MARPEYKPTDKDRATVQTMAAYGIPQADIAAVVNCDLKTLRKHFRAELDTAAAQANARVAAALFRKATGEGPQSVTAAIFWLKTRAGWIDRSAVEHSGPGGGPIQSEATVSDDLRQALDAIAGKIAGGTGAGEMAGDSEADADNPAG